MIHNLYQLFKSLFSEFSLYYLRIFNFSRNSRNHFLPRDLFRQITFILVMPRSGIAEIFAEIFSVLESANPSDLPMTYLEIAEKSGIHEQTIAKYIPLIEMIQDKPHLENNFKRGVFMVKLNQDHKKISSFHEIIKHLRSYAKETRFDLELVKILEILEKID